ncbi:MAG: MBL fold metallo-hydrolase [Planctomycetota bacterium]|nr:MBL fold metallo-hydrolase [Planctomycetota bacterium]MDP6520359.1 MBL fold metallo-hydrolase [Planctomycetota bacterium]MDP6955638.1 MBL fold metallo-hydrolase [Planctomycetota bacterium]
MHLTVLSSGSGGNSILIRADDTRVLVDAGLTARAMTERLVLAGVPHRSIQHILVTHAHLDHARSSGILAKRHQALLHCPEAMMRNKSAARSPRLAALRPGVPVLLPGPGANSEARVGDTQSHTAPDTLAPSTSAPRASGAPAPLTATAVPIPHDCDPTVAYAFDHGGRRAVILTDMGEPRPALARRLAGAHVLVLEFNHDERMLAEGPYPPLLKRRVAGVGGHLSNTQAANMLRYLAGPQLHTLVLAHLSEKNNSPDLALAAARQTLAEMGLDGVRVLAAEQHEVGPNLRV